MAIQSQMTSSNDLKMDGSSTNKAVVSDYLGYGSFSGADTKVIVHLPKSLRAQRQLQAEIAEIEERLKEATEVLFYGGGTRIQQKQAAEIQGDPDRLIAIYNELNFLESELANAKKNYNDYLTLPTTKVLGEIQTISWGTFREKSPVRTLGSVYPRAYTRGPRCIPAGEKVFIENKGIVNIEEVKPNDAVQSSGISFNKVINTFQQGQKECYLLKLENGYFLRASYDHPISTEDGWTEMKNLVVRQKVHVVGSVPSHDNDYDICDDMLIMIAYLIGDGTTRRYNYNNKKTTRIGLSISDIEMDTIGEESERILKSIETDFKDNRKPTDKCITRSINVCTSGKGLTDWRKREYNLLHKTLKQYNLYNKYSHNKEIPESFLVDLSTRQIRLFLSRLFSTDGCYSVSKCNKYIEFKYTSTSEKLIDQIRILLGKLGLNCIKNKENKTGKTGGKEDIISRHDAYSIVISDALELIRFVKRVGIFGKDNKITPLLPILKSRIKCHFLDVDHDLFILKAKKALDRAVLPRKKILDKYNVYNKNLKITPRKAIKISHDINDNEFSFFVNELIEKLIDKRENIINRKVVSIESIGELEVFDLEVEDRHCFSCNGIIVHNTIGGSMIFTIFYEHVFHELLKGNFGYYSTGTSDFDTNLITTVLPDQLPPLDISLVFANEYGAVSHMGLWGVEFVQEGGTFSIEDIFSENTVQYVCRDLDPMRLAQTAERENKGIKITTSWTKTASQMSADAADERYRNGWIARRNPFI